MDHFDLTQWTDYVRGVTPSVVSREMAEHAGHCSLCSLNLGFLLHVTETATADRAFAPPQHAVESAELIFPSPADVRHNGWAGLRRLAASVIWNSAVDPMPAGVRSMRPDAKHYVYRAGRYSIDLMLDGDAETSLVTMTGQIADESTPGSPLGNTKALLFSGQRIVAATTSNAFGEFLIRYEPSENLNLLLPVEQTGEYLELSLDLPQDARQDVQQVDA